MEGSCPQCGNTTGTCEHAAGALQDGGSDTAPAAPSEDEGGMAA